MEQEKCVCYVYDGCDDNCTFDNCDKRLNREKQIRLNTIQRRTEFQQQSKKDRDKWCSHCGCEGGCDLCKYINE